MNLGRPDSLANPVSGSGLLLLLGASLLAWRTLGVGARDGSRGSWATGACQFLHFCSDSHSSFTDSMRLLAMSVSERLSPDNTGEDRHEDQRDSLNAETVKV